MTQQQHEDYTLSSKKYSNEVKWWSDEVCNEKNPYLIKKPGIFIPSAVKVDCQAYLRGLWKACQGKEVKLIKSSISTLDELKDYDAIIAAIGPNSKLISEFSTYKMSLVKGQLLELEWPKHLTPLPFSVNSQAYVVPHLHQRICYAGSTFERNFASPLPVFSVAKSDILPKVIDMIPTLENVKIINCHAGIRVTTPTRLPYAERVNERLWIFTGLGSKGLLYHALFANKMCSAICKNDKKDA